MSNELTVDGPDGIRRGYDEHYDTIMDVEQDPTGAYHAIQKQHARIEELEAKLAKAVVIAMDAIDTMEAGPFFRDQEAKRLLASLAELKGEKE
jgi:hypothetical protein